MFNWALDLQGLLVHTQINIWKFGHVWNEHPPLEQDIWQKTCTLFGHSLLIKLASMRWLLCPPPSHSLDHPVVTSDCKKQIYKQPKYNHWGSSWHHGVHIHRLYTVYGYNLIRLFYMTLCIFMMYFEIFRKTSSNYIINKDYWLFGENIFLDFGKKKSLL